MATRAQAAQDLAVGIITQIEHDNIVRDLDTQEAQALQQQGSEALADPGLQGQVVADPIAPKPIAPPAPVIEPTPIQTLIPTDIPVGVEATQKFKQPTAAFKEAADAKVTAIDAEKVATRKILEAQAGAAAQEAALRQKAIAEQQKTEAEARVAEQAAFKEQEERLAGIDTQIEEFKNQKYEGFWENRGTATKIGAALAMALGAYAQGISGGKVPNTALSIINKAMDDDFKQFKQKQVSLINSINQSKLSSDQKRALSQQKVDAIRAKKIAQNDALSARLASLKASSKNPAAIAKIGQIEAQLEQRKQADIMKIQDEFAVETTQKIKGMAGVDPAKPVAVTKGQVKVDEDYAKDYNKFTSKGRSNAIAAITKLEALATEMEADVGFGEAGGGRFADVMPDVLRSRDAIRRRDDTRNAANTTLKELFGGQLSDAEREAAAKEYYNDALDNETNAKILRRKIGELRSNVVNQTDKADYYEQHGTLTGWKGLKQEMKPQTIRKTVNGITYEKVDGGWQKL